MSKTSLLLTLTIFYSFCASAMTDQEAVNKCLDIFKTHPFSIKNPKFRTINPSVKIFGIGADVNDDKRSPNSELILVKTAVSVLSKTKYNLLNPNGWYCLKSKVAVLAKTQIILDCSSKLATPKTNLVILGRDKSAKGGITILGKTKIKRINCKK